MKKTTTAAVAHWPTARAAITPRVISVCEMTCRRSGRPDDVAKDRVAGGDDDRQADRPGDALGELLEQPEPLANHDDEQHCAKDDPEQGQRARRLKSPRSAFLAGVRRRRAPALAELGDGVACAFDRPADGRQVDQRGIIAQAGLFGRQEDVDRRERRAGPRWLADVHGALGAVHALDRDFEVLWFGHR